MKKNTVPVKVSVGLSVFNESKKIISVLKGILSQLQKGWSLEEILVYDDCSTDDTYKKIKNFKNEYIKVNTDTERMGKTYQLSRMFRDFSGNILIMFDGDIELVGKNVISEMVSSFKDDKVMLVSGNSKPVPPKNFFQRSVYTTYLVFDKSRKQIKDGNNVFGVAGCILAIRKSLARQINLPGIINEDVYIYLSCISDGWKFKYNDKAEVLYTLPDNLSDYLRQAFRSHPQAVHLDLTKHFGDRINEEFKRPTKFYLKSILEIFLRYPLEVISIIIVNILCRPFYGFVVKRYKLSWFTAKSTH